MALVFAHPLGAAVAFAAIPFLALAVPPSLIARSALNVTVALTFPALFMTLAFVYASWVFPGDGWSLVIAPAQSLPLWRAAMARVFGGGFFGMPAIDAAAAMLLALALAAPVVPVMLALVFRRRGLVTPVSAFVGAVLVATIVCVVDGLFGDPAALVVAAPALAAAVMIRVPEAPARARLVLALLVLGWPAGGLGVAIIDPLVVARLQTVLNHGAGDQADALAAGGATAGRDGVLADTDDAPALVVGRGAARGLLGSGSEQFALAMLFARIDTPFVAVPDPHSRAGVDDRLDRAFPALFRQGLPGYRLIYQNSTWRLFGKTGEATVSEK
jgi:membrane protein XagC